MLSNLKRIEDTYQPTMVIGLWRHLTPANYANCHQTDLQTKSRSNHYHIDRRFAKGLQSGGQTSKNQNFWVS